MTSRRLMWAAIMACPLLIGFLTLSLVLGNYGIAAYDAAVLSLYLVIMTADIEAMVRALRKRIKK